MYGSPDGRPRRAPSPVTRTPVDALRAFARATLLVRRAREVAAHHGARAAVVGTARAGLPLIAGLIAATRCCGVARRERWAAARARRPAIEVGARREPVAIEIGVVGARFVGA